jgi:hypothetical protein
MTLALWGERDIFIWCLLTALWRYTTAGLVIEEP